MVWGTPPPPPFELRKKYKMGEENTWEKRLLQIPMLRKGGAPPPYLISNLVIKKIATHLLLGVHRDLQDRLPVPPRRQDRAPRNRDGQR